METYKIQFILGTEGENQGEKEIATGRQVPQEAAQIANAPPSREVNVPSPELLANVPEEAQRKAQQSLN